MCKLALCMCVFAAAACSQSIYYVATNGSDTAGNGSSSAPWASIGKAVQSIPDDGSVIVVRNGVYGQTTLSRKFSKPVIIRAENAYGAKIRNADSVAVTLYYAKNIEMSGFDIARTNPSSSNPLLFKIAGGDTLVLRNNIFHESYNNDLLKVNEGTRNLLIVGNVFRNPAGTAGQHIDINGCVDVTIQENIFFNDAAAAGISTSTINLTHGFIVVKNSSGYPAYPESRRTRIVGNVFLNFQGSAGSNFVLLGEDGYSYYEVEDVTIENNLMLGNSSTPMRAPFGVKGARNALFRNNTVAGDLPGSAFAVRFNQEVVNPVNDGMRLRNNIWSDPNGTMGDFADGSKTESRNVQLDNNIYWNGGSAIPDDGEVIAATMDIRALLANPLLPSQAGMVLPNWKGTQFASGTATIRAEFERLVRTYGNPAVSSPVIGRGDASDSPEADILGAARGATPDVGALQVSAPAPSLRMALFTPRLLGGRTITLNQVALPHTNGGVVFLSSSNPAVASVPVSVSIPAGQESASFTIATNPVSTSMPVQITATVGNAVQTATLTVVPQGVASVNPYNERPKAGDSQHWILMEGPVDADTPITFTSSQPDLVSFPSSTVVAAGDVHAKFTVHCSGVSAPTPVIITASAGNSQASALFTFQPSSTMPAKVALSSISLDSTNITGGSSVTGTVYLTAPAPGSGAAVSITAIPTGILSPISVTVPANASSAKFTIPTVAVTAPTTVIVSASYAGGTKTATLTVNPVTTSKVVPIGVSFVNPITPPAVGSQQKLTVLLSGGASENGLGIILSTTRPDLVSFASLVTVPAGQSKLDVAFSVAAVTSSQTVTISASANGVTVTRSLTINPHSSTTKPVITDIRVQTPVRPGTASFTIQISSPAPGGGYPVWLSTLRADLIILPEKLMIPEGETQITGSMTIAQAWRTQIVGVTAVSFGTSKTVGISIEP